jgi:hypothetical protein
VLDGNQVGELYSVIDDLFKTDKTELIDFDDYL